jgi:ornithine carbamoyltransferase
MKRDLISILDLTPADLSELLHSAARLKEQRNLGVLQEPLGKRTLGMIFEKASTRTRISFEVGMFELGGHALFLNAQDLQLGRGEEIRDTARVFSRYVSAVMIRAFRHETITEFARYSTIPVINGLSDREHPCQILADLLTLKEQFGSLEHLTIAWIGDGNNVCNSLMLSSALTGYTVKVATPPEYQPSGEILRKAREAGADVTLYSSPNEAVSGADVVYTDTWVSMGSESEHEERMARFSGFTVTEELLRTEAPDALVMHCLPAHRGEEITDGVMEGPQSIIWEQAENRLHAQKALLVMLITGSSG